ncbi:hypothetical protein [Curtobacterium sp. MCBD17_040]|uniref:hypothetical protein n=1 Tax=Curtobacterium sp. MCBD17_040 TaxID=2175674 RepID=UPI000DA9D1FD|nr:hypothetical protein [Curtobacterium sp. MCBD17_040]WIB65460.1 hypothetical protein DEI94_18990 [Curtobacterium sp. MCBD17_040]
MTNSSKDKGDRGEREAVEAFQTLCPDLLVWNAQRLLGAGRKEDVGDLLVIDDVAVQVKAFAAKYLSKGVYEAANGAAIQAGHARKPHAVGMVLVPRARKDKVRWVMVAHTWPAPIDEIATASSATAAFDAVVKAGIDTPFTVRLARKDKPELVLGSLPTWVAAYRSATGRHQRAQKTA